MHLNDTDTHSTTNPEVALLLAIASSRQTILGSSEIWSRPRAVWMTWVGWMAWHGSTCIQGPRQSHEDLIEFAHFSWSGGGAFSHCMFGTAKQGHKPTHIFMGPTCRQQCGIDKLHFHCYWIPKTRYILRRKISVVVLIGFQLWHVLSGLLGVFAIWCLSIVTPCCDRQMCSPIPMFQPVPTMFQPLPTVKFPSI